MKGRFLLILAGLILLSTRLLGQWVVKHVEVKGQTIFDLEMLPDGTGMAVGSSGLILRSDDYGENWMPISGNVDRNIFQIGLIAEDTIVVRGDNDQLDGSIYKSVDGGYTWETVYTHFSDLFSLQFFNDSVGLASGTNKIFRSTDGGSTWSSVYDVPVFTNFKTGLIWMDVASDTVAYAGVLAWQSGVTNLTRYLLKSVDAGLTWKECKELGKEFGYCELYFYDEWHGFYDWDFPKRTLDGGVTWDTTNNIGFMLDMSMPSPNKVYSVNRPFGYLPDFLYTEFAICTSADGGLTWQGELAPGAHLETILFINDSVGFVAGDHSLIMKTEHGGGEIIGDYPWELYTGTDRVVEHRVQLKIHPNPAREQVLISWPEMHHGPLLLSIVDAGTGTAIEHHTLYAPFHLMLESSSWAAGSYFVTVRAKDTGHPVTSRKLIITK